MYHVYRITETFMLRKTIAIINIADACSDITVVKRTAVDGAM